jgi:hypothetical protein
VATIARRLAVPKSGLYARRKRPDSERDVANAALSAVDKAVYHDVRGTCGASGILANEKLRYEMGTGTAEA